MNQQHHLSDYSPAIAQVFYPTIGNGERLTYKDLLQLNAIASYAAFIAETLDKRVKLVEFGWTVKHLFGDKFTGLEGAKNLNETTQEWWIQEAWWTEFESKDWIQFANWCQNLIKSRFQDIKK